MTLYNHFYTYTTLRCCQCTIMHSLYAYHALFTLHKYVLTMSQLYTLTVGAGTGIELKYITFWKSYLYTTVEKSPDIDELKEYFR